MNSPGFLKSLGDEIASHCKSALLRLLLITSKSFIYDHRELGGTTFLVIEIAMKLGWGKNSIAMLVS